MKEFVGLPEGKKARLMRIMGKDGVVQFGDVTAVKDAKAYVPSGWFGGESTLDFMKVVDGVTVDDRYVVP